MKKQFTAKNMFMAMTALAGWFALAIFFVSTMNSAHDKGQSVAFGVIRFFSFFTILTNLLVALSLTIPLLKPASKAGQFFSSPRITSGITMFIAVVGIVYFLALRNTWDPQGALLVANVLCHYAIPAAYVAYWLIGVPKGSLVWKDAIAWLSFPAIYTLLVLLRGAVTGLYPYPFLDANELGYPRVLVNMTTQLMVFLVIGVLLITLDRLMRPKQTAIYQQDNA